MMIVDEIVAGADIRDVLFSCTPGSGKSQIPVIFGKLIELGFADAICWICPRKSLQFQGESGFADPFFRKMFSHTMLIRASTNETDPCRGLSGFVTTYQAIGLDLNKTVLTEIRSKRYILVLDENHHIETESIWEESIVPIYNEAKYRVRMTGTLERNSGKMIAFTPYVKSDGGYQPSLDPESGRVVTYSRSDALSEKAIIPLQFFFQDAETEWEEEKWDEEKQQTGTVIKKYGSLNSVKPQDRGKALYTAIETDCAKELIDKCIAHWVEHKKINPSAKMLIITASIKNAKEALKHLRNRFYPSNIATSKETKEAMRAIEQFKQGDIEILCGVAMFYEGFDCPAISHIALLTRIRSTPWLEQALARAVRVNRALAYGLQRGFIFTMDDPEMMDTVLKIQAEQLPFASLSKLPEEEGEKQLGLFDPPDDYEYKPYNIDPISSGITNGREIILGDHWPDLDDIQYDPQEITCDTPSETESGLRRQINRIVNDFCHTYKYEQQTANTEIRVLFGKARADMTIPELIKVLEYVQRTYATQGNVRRVSRREATRYYGDSAA